jgi:PAS domain-containing protein
VKNGRVNNQAIKITIIYLIASALYVFFFYKIVHDITHEPALFKNSHTYIGIALVVLTSIFVFFHVLHILKKQHRITNLYRDSNEYFRKIFENAPTGIAISQWDGTFDQCNPAFCRMLGYTADEIKSLKFSDAVVRSRLIIRKTLMGGIPHLTYYEPVISDYKTGKRD